jgi:hypothetical protein
MLGALLGTLLGYQAAAYTLLASIVDHAVAFHVHVRAGEGAAGSVGGGKFVSPVSV